MKTIATFLVLLTWSALSAQQKSITPLPAVASAKAGAATYAVVIGISDYQNPAIPKLSYADKDAESFANFLRSPGGGPLDEDHLQVLLNSDATQGQCVEAFGWLTESCKEGDQAIIYFSGHGDVEQKSFSQPGYLLCWNAPSRLYSAGGAINLRDLQEVINTLSISKNAKVVVIADACRSGKLSGSGLDGAKLTTANLAQQAANETKFLSCQANQYSLEGKQWGGGHGAFSYHLIDGLFGLADRNSDGMVTSGELDRYLEDHVTPETQPNVQEPLLVGSKSEPLFPVDATIVANLKKNKSGELPEFKPVKVKGLADRVLATVDSSVRLTYIAYKKSIKEKRFFSPAGNCAEDYYQKLIQVEALAPLYGAMKRKYAAGLQDDAQQIIQGYLSADPTRLGGESKWSTLSNIPPQLARAAALLGEGHYMYSALQARKLLFEAILLRWERYDQDEALARRCISLCRQSAALEPQSPLPWIIMGGTYATNLRQPDSAFICTREASNMLPKSVTPYSLLAYNLMAINEWDWAHQAIVAAEAIDPEHPFVSDLWGEWYFRQAGAANLKKALPWFEKCQQQGGLEVAWWHANFGMMLCEVGRYSESESEFRKSLALDSSLVWVWSNFGNLYNQTHRFAEAEQMLKKAIALDSTSAQAHYQLGRTYLKTKRQEDAEREYFKTLALNPNAILTRMSLASIRFAEGKTTEAIGYVEQAIGKGATLELLESDEDLAPMRALPDWETMMKKHFADQIYYNLACEQSLKGELDKAFETLELSLSKGWKDYDWMQQDTDLAPLRERTERWGALMKKYFPDKGKN